MKTGQICFFFSLNFKNNTPCISKTKENTNKSTAAIVGNCLNLKPFINYTLRHQHKQEELAVQLKKLENTTRTCSHKITQK